MNQVKKYIVIILLGYLSLFCFSSILASPLTFKAGLGSFVGNGNVSNGENVNMVSAYTVFLESPYQTSTGIVIGPTFEFLNSFVNTKTEAENATWISNYDNRIFSLGVHLGKKIDDKSLPMEEIFLLLSGGRGFSKITKDENTENSYTQHLYNGITGNYFSGTVGTVVPIKDNLKADFSLLASIYKTDQHNADGTYSGYRAEESGIYNLTGVYQKKNNSLPDTLFQKVYAFKLGLSLSL